MKPEPQNSSSQESQNKIAFLIVDGSRVVIMDKPVLNIGRKSDNHIVIDNEHVSRYHAQIRLYRGEYFILDLNSTVGTSVNGSRIDRVALRPGDVISLGGVPILFGRGASSETLDMFDTLQNQDGDSAPTENTGINAADQYLNMFTTSEE